MVEPGSWRNPHEQSDPGGWDAPPPLVGQRRGRPGLVALFVVLVELVVIAAACNQSVTKHEVTYAGEHHTFLGRAVGSLLTFSWRVSPTRGDNRDGFHFLWSQLLSIGVFVVLSALLTLVVVRGPITFWRAFFGIWTAVLAAACVGRAVGSSITVSPIPSFDRGSYAVFGAVNGGVVFIGLVIGLVAAVIAAIIAAATRRTVAAEPNFLTPGAAAPQPVPETPPPFYGNPAADPRAEGATTAFPSMSKDQPSEARTERLPDTSQYGESREPREPRESREPREPEPQNQTTQLPRFDPRGGQNWTPPQRGGGDEGGESTQAFPAPGDGEPRR